MSDSPKVKSEYVGMIFEGEWPAVKEAARSVRRVVWGVYGFLHSALYFPGATSAFSNGLHHIDQGVHHSSHHVASVLNRSSPWLPSASAVVMSSLVATVKSNHYWGPVAAARNGMVTMAAATLFMFPGEIRDACGFGEKA